MIGGIFDATPEIFLLAALCVVLLLEIFFGKDMSVAAYLAAQTSLLATLLLVYSSFGLAKPLLTLEGMYIRDALAVVLKISVLLITIVVFFYARKYLREHVIWQGEFFIFCISAVLGVMILISAYNLLILYLGLELMSLSLYALIAMRRDDTRSTEAAMKYFVLGAIASGFLLYGMSMLYGLSGSLNIEELAAYFKAQPSLETNLPLLFALAFILIGVLFKFGVFPFHMWMPDVYQGAPTLVVLFLSTVPKLAAFALLVRLVVEGLGAAQSSWTQVLLAFSLLSIVFGNIVAIAQTSFKRMLAYSAIAHMGFILMAVLANNTSGYGAALFYLLAYVLMSSGAFGVLIMLGREGYELDHIDDLKGLHQRAPWAAFILLLILLSMAGLPPFIGFYAKLTVIQAVIGNQLVLAAIVMVLMSVVGAYYYLRVIKVMYFDTPDEHALPIQVSRSQKMMVTSHCLLVLILGVFPNALMHLCFNAVLSSNLESHLEAEAVPQSVDG